MSEQIEILLVEDNPDDAELAVHALRKGKLTQNIKHVNDGVEALEFLFGTGQFEGRDTDQKPKLILLDLNMPRIGGMEVLDKIKNDERTRRIPVVVLTSSHESPDLVNCYGLGASSYIVKPVNTETVTKAMQEIGIYSMLINEQLPGQ